MTYEKNVKVELNCIEWES